MKVAHVAPSYYPAHVYGGPPESTYQLTAHLARRGVPVRVLTTDANGLHAVLDVDTTREIELEPNLLVRYCPRVLLHSTSPALLRHLLDYVRWGDVVHLMGVYNFTTIPTMAACAALKKPLVWSPRGALQRWENVSRPRLKEAWEAVCRAISPARVVLHVTSESEEAQSRKRMPNASSALIPNGVVVPRELARRSPGYDGAPGLPLKMLYLGRLHPIKGLDNLLAALGHYNARAGRPWSLTLAGGGDADYAAKLRRTIAELGLGAQVQMVGELRDEAKARAFCEHDLFVAPSYTENFGIAIAEALAHGLPVIAGKGTPWQGLESRGAGLWVDNDPASLTDAIARAAAMPLAEMGQRGRAWVAESFSWDHAAAEMLAVYHRLVAPS